MSPKAETACSVVSVSSFSVTQAGTRCPWWPVADSMNSAFPPCQFWTSAFFAMLNSPFLLSLSVPLASLLALISSFLISVTPYRGKLTNHTVCQGLAAVTVFLLTVDSGDPSSTPVGFWISDGTSWEDLKIWCISEICYISEFHTVDSEERRYFNEPGDAKCWTLLLLL